MPNKRSRRKQTQKVYCPYCERRLWRVGGEKYHIFYADKTEIQKGMGLTHKKASFVAVQQGTTVDRQVWLEEFFCEEHGKMWLRLKKIDEKAFESKLATKEDWQRSTRTPNPEKPNPSVSEFTLRMSRRTNGQAFKRFYE